jgi:CheY-like chemotaxis protein
MRSSLLRAAKWCVKRYLTMYSYKSIFLADDDVQDQEIFMEAINLVDNTIKLFSAPDGVAALQTLSVGQKPDLIFLDVNMPLLNGKQLLAELKKIDSLRKIPVIMYSTFFGEKDIQEIQKLGAAHHLLKPASFDLLVNSLQAILGKKW